jgi:hypothetical protein
LTDRRPGSVHKAGSPTTGLPSTSFGHIVHGLMALRVIERRVNQRTTKPDMVS